MDYYVPFSELKWKDKNTPYARCRRCDRIVLFQIEEGDVTVGWCWNCDTENIVDYGDIDGAVAESG